MRFFLLLTGILSALAQATGRYTLEQCFERALKQSEVVAEQAQLLVQADEHYSQAIGSMLPSLSGSASYQHQQDPGSASAQSFSPVDQTTVKVSVTQPLFRGLRDLAALKQKRQQQAAQKYAVDQAVVQLFNDVQQAFYNVLSFEHDRKNYLGELETNSKRLSEMKRFRRMARAREADTLVIEATIANLEAQVESTNGQLRSARETLAFLTGLDHSLELSDTESIPQNLPTLEGYLNRIHERPDVLSAKQDWEAAEQGIQVARGAHFPSIDLTGNYYPVRPGLLQNVTWDVGIVATIPIFAGGVTQSLVREAVSQKTGKELAYIRAKRQAEQDIRTLYSTVQADTAQVAKLVKAASLTRRSYTLEWKDYRAGLATNLDVLQAGTTALDTQRALDKATFTSKIDYGRLQAAAALRPKHEHKEK